MRAGVTPFPTVKIILSYPSEERGVAERVNYALLALGHDVFFDREDLPAGLTYDQAIVNAIDSSDLFVFLITPAAVTAGRYTLTELGLAQRRWPRPSGRVLPVMLRPTPIDLVPAYLRAVSFYTPSGDAVAEIAHETQRLARALPLTIQATRRLRSRSGALAAAVAVVAIGAAGWFATRNVAASRDSTRVSGDSVQALAEPIPFPADVRHRARAVASGTRTERGHIA